MGINEYTSNCSNQEVDLEGGFSSVEGPRKEEYGVVQLMRSLVAGILFQARGGHVPVTTPGDTSDTIITLMHWQLIDIL